MQSLTELDLDGKVNYWLHAHLIDLGLNEGSAIVVKVLFFVFATLVIGFITNYITKQIIVKVIETIIKRSETIYDDYFVEHKVFHHLSHLAPASVVYFLSNIFLADYPEVDEFVKHAMLVYITITVVRSLKAFFDAIQDIYEHMPYAADRPIKGYLQVLKIVLYFMAFLVVISIMFGVKLMSIFAGLGAMAAVLLLIFKDTLLGFSASIQLSANKMVSVGDWITMPSHNADGTVLEVSLNTVKIQNFDKSISTIPTYAMVSNSFMNWKGMLDSGGRRIKRSINIDMKTVKFCTPEMIEKYRKIHFLQEFIPMREKEIKEYNEALIIDHTIPVNGRRMTNLGVFRHYLENYLKSHPKVHKEFTTMVRQLQPTEKGIPIEIVCFTIEQASISYEDFQADIFDHILSILQEFELKVFQFPTTDPTAVLGE